MHKICIYKVTMPTVAMYLKKIINNAWCTYWNPFKDMPRRDELKDISAFKNCKN